MLQTFLWTETKALDAYSVWFQQNRKTYRTVGSYVPRLFNLDAQRQHRVVALVPPIFRIGLSQKQHVPKCAENNHDLSQRIHKVIGEIVIEPCGVLKLR